MRFSHNFSMSIMIFALLIVANSASPLPYSYLQLAPRTFSKQIAEFEVTLSNTKKSIAFHKFVIQIDRNDIPVNRTLKYDHTFIFPSSLTLLKGLKMKVDMYYITPKGRKLIQSSSQSLILQILQGSSFRALQLFFGNIDASLKSAVPQEYFTNEAKIMFVIPSDEIMIGQKIPFTNPHFMISQSFIHIRRPKITKLSTIQYFKQLTGDQQIKVSLEYKTALEVLSRIQTHKDLRLTKYQTPYEQQFYWKQYLDIIIQDNIQDLNEPIVKLNIWNHFHLGGQISKNLNATIKILDADFIKISFEYVFYLGMWVYDVVVIVFCTIAATILEIRMYKKTESKLQLGVAKCWSLLPIIMYLMNFVMNDYPLYHFTPFGVIAFLFQAWKLSKINKLEAQIDKMTQKMPKAKLESNTNEKSHHSLSVKQMIKNMKNKKNGKVKEITKAQTSQISMVEQKQPQQKLKVYKYFKRINNQYSKLRVFYFFSFLCFISYVVCTSNFRNDLLNQGPISMFIYVLSSIPYLIAKYHMVVAIACQMVINSKLKSVKHMSKCLIYVYIMQSLTNNHELYDGNCTIFTALFVLKEEIMLCLLLMQHSAYEDHEPIHQHYQYCGCPGYKNPNK